MLSKQKGCFFNYIKPNALSEMLIVFTMYTALLN